MTREEFIKQVGAGAAIALLTTCGVSCKKTSTTPTPQGPSNVDFTVSTASGPLSTNGGFIFQNGVIIARTNTGAFIAVASACTHEGTSINFTAGTNDFTCPNHGAKFDVNGNVTNGPASMPLKKYNTTISGTTLHVFS